MPKFVKPIIFIVFMCAIATASYAQNPDSTPAPISQTEPSLAPPSFQTLGKHASNSIRMDPDADWNSYRAYRLRPAVYQPSSPKHTLNPSDAGKITATVDRSLQKTFRKTVASDGAVLDVRPIVTAVRRTSTLLNVVGYLAIQAPISFGGATIRYELSDSETGKLIGVVSCKRDARPWNVYPWDVIPNFEALGQGSVILKSDSGRLRKDLDRLGKLPNMPAKQFVASAE